MNCEASICRMGDPITDELMRAREIVADARDHDDAAVITACRTIERHSDDKDEVDLARRLRSFILKEPITGAAS